MAHLLADRLLFTVFTLIVRHLIALGATPEPLLQLTLLPPETRKRAAHGSLTPLDPSRPTSRRRTVISVPLLRRCDPTNFVGAARICGLKEIKLLILTFSVWILLVPRIPLLTWILTPLRPSLVPLVLPHIRIEARRTRTALANPPFDDALTL